MKKPDFRIITKNGGFYIQRRTTFLSIFTTWHDIVHHDEVARKYPNISTRIYMIELPSTFAYDTFEHAEADLFRIRESMKKCPIGPMRVIKEYPMEA